MDISQVELFYYLIKSPFLYWQQSNIYINTLFHWRYPKTKEHLLHCYIKPSIEHGIDFGVKLFKQCWDM